MIKISVRGNYEKTTKFLMKASKLNFKGILAKYGAKGVDSLASATPKDTGDTASKWNYEISMRSSGFTITWSNSNKEFGAPVAILLQYGHGLQNGGFVQGRDYINPAMRPIFETIAQDLFKEVSEL